MVEERPVIGRRQTVRTAGRGRRENAGMSSENYVRIIMAEYLRFPGAGSSSLGQPELRRGREA